MIFLIFTSATFSGKLADFERGKTEKSKTNSTSKTKKTKNKEYKKYNDNTEEESLGGDLFGLLFQETIGAITLFLFVGSEEYRNNSSIENYFNHHPGEWQMPYLKTQIVPQWTFNRIASFDSRIEMGYKPVAIELRNTYFNDFESGNSVETLSSTQLLFLFRWLRDQYLEMNLGMGPSWLNGENSFSGVSFLFKFRLKPFDHFGFEFKPSVSVLNSKTGEKQNVFTEMNYSLYFINKHYDISVGYQKLDSYGNSLNSLNIGTSFFY